jgi:hypothetical protein
MDPNLAPYIFRLTCILSGVAFGYFGFKLLVLALFGRTGDTDPVFRSTRLLVLKAVPGVCFAVFGAFVITFTLLKGFRSIPAVSVEKLGKPPAWQPTAEDINRVIGSSTEAPSIANPDAIRLQDDSKDAAISLEEMREQALKPKEPEKTQE